MRTLASRSVERRTDDSITVAIVEAVAQAKGVDPDDLDLVLDDVIQADALESIFATDARARRRGTVSFPWDEFVVEVRVTAEDSARVRVGASGPDSRGRTADGPENRVEAR